MQEIWKEIPNFEGYYKISSLGKIVSIRSNKMMKTSFDKKGCEHVYFSVNGIKSSYLVSRLMAATFMGYDMNNKEYLITHKNGKTNELSNLMIVNRRLIERRKNALGIIGVNKLKNGKYRSCIRLNGVGLNLGHFDTPEKAHDEYKKFYKKYVLNR